MRSVSVDLKVFVGKEKERTTLPAKPPAMRARSTKRKRCARQTARESSKVLVDQVDDENAEERAYPGHPVCEGDVHGHRAVRLVVWWVSMRGEDGSIEEGPKSQGRTGQKKGS